MTDSPWPKLADDLTKALGLQHPPIAITFTNKTVESAPIFEAAIPAPSPDGRTGKVSAGCVFWIKATNQTFTTLPADHYNCSVGSVTPHTHQANKAGNSNSWSTSNSNTSRQAKARA